MELLQHAATAGRPYLMGSSSAPTLSLRVITRRVLTKAAVLLVLMSLLGMASAAEPSSPRSSQTELTVTVPHH